MIKMVKSLVLYHSQEYGNTKKMAEAVAEGLKSKGCEVTLHNMNEGRYPIEDFPEYDSVAFGTPDYFGYLAGTMKTFLDDWYFNKKIKGYRDKPYAIFYSHGGGSRVKRSFTLFRGIGNQIGKPVESNGTPNTDVLDMCMALGVELAKASQK